MKRNHWNRTLRKKIKANKLSKSTRKGRRPMRRKKVSVLVAIDKNFRRNKRLKLEVVYLIIIVNHILKKSKKVIGVVLNKMRDLQIEKLKKIKGESLKLLSIILEKILKNILKMTIKKLTKSEIGTKLETSVKKNLFTRIKDRKK